VHFVGSYYSDMYMSQADLLKSSICRSLCSLRRVTSSLPQLICVSCITWHWYKLPETLTLARGTIADVWARNAERGMGRGVGEIKKFLSC